MGVDLRERFGTRTPMLIGLLSAFMALAATGCKTVHCSEQNFANAFEGQKVIRLANECYQLAYDAHFSARNDFLYGPYRPSPSDREALYWLARISEKAPWIAVDIKKNPTSPRCSSKDSFDLVAFDATMLKRRYRPASYQPPTAAKIDQLLRRTDELSVYYELKQPERRSAGKNRLRVVSAAANSRYGL